MNKSNNFYHFSVMSHLQRYSIHPWDAAVKNTVTHTVLAY